MKERPILFSGEMVRAILSGHKTQTRRVMKEPWKVRLPLTVRGDWPFQGTWAAPGIYEAHHNQYGAVSVKATSNGSMLGIKPAEFEWVCPYGKPGDRLWVRETWRTEKGIDKMDAAQMVESCLDAGYRSPWAPIRYEADGHFDNWDQGQEVGRLRPAIHMPGWASRLTLEVVSVRVERLRDISEADAKAEGADFAQSDDGDMNAFNNMWDVINEKRGFTWMSNPWVWVIEFKRVQP